MSRKTRIGKFGFVNNFLPYYRLEQNGVAVVEASPKRLAGLLERGEVDFAPVPSFYYLKNKEKLRSYEFCVASTERVLSVVVVSERAGRLERGAGLEGEWRNGCVAATNQTVTSLNLLKIILRERGLGEAGLGKEGLGEAELGEAWEVKVVNESRAGELLKHGTHALVIGDEAIRARLTNKYRVELDLGAEWRELTGCPMVFGISASPREKELGEESRKVLESLAWGEKHVEVVVGEAEKKFGMPAEFLREYFNSLTYRLGARERRGLELFEEKCYEFGLL